MMTEEIAEQRHSGYDHSFFASRLALSYDSAREILPWVLELTAARSVIDVGCGSGTWVRVCRECGVDAIGWDGPWVTSAELVIETDFFKVVRLDDPVSLPRGQRVDLVISLEVAEHLPTEVARDFVSALTSYTDTVLFSGACPGQGGVGHVNERPPEFWIALFDAEGFACFDVVRGQFWDNVRVAPWYAQNSFIFVRRPSPMLERLGARAVSGASLAGRHLIHPRLYETRVSALKSPQNYSIRGIVLAFPTYLRRIISGVWRNKR